MNDPLTILRGNCRETLKLLAEESIDSCVTDPPYELGFMGKGWDKSGVAFEVATWREVFRVLKPGAHLLAFGGTRTYHRMACAIEDAGFEIRDQIQWLYGSGFPKSLDVSKAIDKAAGVEREVVGENPNARKAQEVYSLDGQAANFKATYRPITAAATEAAKEWQGWGTALKPAHEPIVVARKPLVGTVAANVLEHGTGALNIDACRVETDENPSGARRKGAINHLSDRPARETEAEGKMVSRQSPEAYRAERPGESLGRWPANVIHDGSEEVLAAFPQTTSGAPCGTRKAAYSWGTEETGTPVTGFGDSGSAARFFYCAKSAKSDRGGGNSHPTVKPTALMRYLARLVTRPGGTVLDPFAGSGSTGVAALEEGFRVVLCELSPEYCELIEKRLRDVTLGMPI